MGARLDTTLKEGLYPFKSNQSLYKRGEQSLYPLALHDEINHSCKIDLGSVTESGFLRLLKPLASTNLLFYSSPI